MNHTATIFAFAALIVAVVVYAWLDPSECRWMPRCIFHSLTGYDCPGCGFQRALHAALHGDLAAAWHLNPFLFFILPVGVIYFLAELFTFPRGKTKSFLYSPITLSIIIATTIAWWIYRNL